MIGFVQPIGSIGFIGSAGSGPAPLSPLTVAVYMTNALAPTADDIALVQHLEGAGHTTLPRSPSDGFDLAGVDLAVVSVSITSGDYDAVTAGLLPATKGVLVMEHVVWQGFGFVSSLPNPFTDHTQGVVEAAGSVLLGVPVGLATLFSSSANIHTTDPDSLASGAVPIIAQAGEITRHLAFAFDAGATLQSGTAAGRRAGFSMGAGALSLHTTAAWAIFDALVAWLGGQP